MAAMVPIPNPTSPVIIPPIWYTMSDIEYAIPH